MSVSYRANRVGNLKVAGVDVKKSSDKRNLADDRLLDAWTNHVEEDFMLG